MVIVSLVPQVLYLIPVERGHTESYLGCSSPCNRKKHWSRSVDKNYQFRRIDPLSLVSAPVITPCKILRAGNVTL